MVEWTPPDAEGRQGCPAHPDVPRFLAREGGCPACRSLHADASEVRTTEMVDAEIEMERAFVQDAEDRGLDDMLELERLGNEARALSRKEAGLCRRRAKFCEARGREILDERTTVMQQDRDGNWIPVDADAAAQRWFSLGKDYRLAVQKSIDTQAKLIKANMPAAAARYRAKSARQLAELKAKGRAN